MNRITAKVTEIKSSEGLSIVSLNTGNIALKGMMREASKELLEKEVTLGVKAINVLLAKGIEAAFGVANSFRVKVKSIELGKLVSRVQVAVSILVSEALLFAQVLSEVGKSIWVLINASDPFIVKVGA